jgi:hypothetical protein
LAVARDLQAAFRPKTIKNSNFLIARMCADKWKLVGFDLFIVVIFYDGECQLHNYLVELHTTSSNYGGIRYWFICLAWVLAGERPFYTAAKSMLVGIAII